MICCVICGVAVWVCCCDGGGGAVDFGIDAVEVVLEVDYADAVGCDVEVVEAGLLDSGDGASPSFMVDNYAPTSTSSPSL